MRLLYFEFPSHLKIVDDSIQYAFEPSAYLKAYKGGDNVTKDISKLGKLQSSKVSTPPRHLALSCQQESELSIKRRSKWLHIYKYGVLQCYDCR